MKFEPVDPDAEHMTLDEFVKACECSAYTDYDGYGVLATDKEMSDVKIYASEYRLLPSMVSNWVTHIVWFNK